MSTPAACGSAQIAAPIRVLLADDQALIRLGFRMVLSSASDIELVGEAETGGLAVDLTTSLRPDVVLMDIRMPGMDGTTRRIVSERPQSRVLILTTFDLDEYAYAALNAGASGFLLKDAQPAELIAAIRTIARGDAVIAPRINAGVRGLGAMLVAGLLWSLMSSATFTVATAVGTRSPSGCWR